MLDVPPTINNDSYHILREEVEAAVKSLKKGKSAGVDNIPSELVQAGGEAMIYIEDSRPEWYISIMIYSQDIPFWSETHHLQSDLADRRVANTLDSLPDHRRKATYNYSHNLQLCPKYRTISLISHRSKVVLRITH